VNYRRALDIANAVASSRFETPEGLAHFREAFVSAPDDVLIIRATGLVNFRAHLDRGIFFDRQWNNGKNSVFIECAQGIPFCVGVRAIAFRDGACVPDAVRVRGGFLSVENADEAIIIVDIRTAFREKDYSGACAESLARVERRIAEVGYEVLISDHVADCRAYYDRAVLRLNDDGQNPDRESIAVARYFNFCRYLLASSSRPGTLPANLQGIWNAHIDPPWGCKYTININAQMNYWPASMCALGEMEFPLFDLMERAYEHGKETARAMYGCRGYVFHHNLDIWGDTAPQDQWIPCQNWVLGAAWLATHIREHYEYSLDADFLAKYYYLMHDACLFFADYLMKRPCRTNAPGEKADGYELFVCPSVSPENTYILPSGKTASLSAGCSMDNQILGALFSATAQSWEDLSSSRLAQDTKLRGEVELFREMLAHIPEPAIHSNGTIREWREEYEEDEPGHRHISHLWALYPGNTISPAKTPALAIAARKTLERRLSCGGGHTGWSRAWIINFYAALHDGKNAYFHLRELFAKSTLPNLFDNHPPFQIDGNFGALAGITRMIAQSELDRCDAALRCANGRVYSVVVDVFILPALPEEWSSGFYGGLRLKGNIEADIGWKTGETKRAVSVTLRNRDAGQKKALCRFPDGTAHSADLRGGETISLSREMTHARDA
jgi:alpha-L-fucosidase 2